MTNMDNTTQPLASNTMTNRDQTLDKLVLDIKNAADLYALRDALVAFEAAADVDQDGYEHRENDIEYDLKSRGIDICERPQFGGTAPKSTAEVWSWDADQLLVGIGPFHEWEIRDRK